MKAKPGSTIQLDAKGTYDPDNNQLTYNWWFYKEAGSFNGNLKIEKSKTQNASFKVPGELNEEVSIHIICEVKDDGIPQLTRYKRVIIKVEP